MAIRATLDFLCSLRISECPSSAPPFKISLKKTKNPYQFAKVKSWEATIHIERQKDKTSLRKKIRKRLESYRARRDPARLKPEGLARLNPQSPRPTMT
jgi:hypothetical protein